MLATGVQKRCNVFPANASGKRGFKMPFTRFQLCNGGQLCLIPMLTTSANNQCNVQTWKTQDITSHTPAQVTAAHTPSRCNTKSAPLPPRTARCSTQFLPVGTYLACGVPSQPLAAPSTNMRAHRTDIPMTGFANHVYFPLVAGHHRG